MPTPTSRGIASYAEILTRLARLRPGSTACPGKLARGLGTTQRALRPVLTRLEAEGRIVVTQRGVVQPLEQLRGPYRVALRGD
jgi:DNA-binding GntR family transcriptional regulator